MKKLIGLVVLLACLVGGAWFLMRPTMLNVQVVLVAEGVDVTDQVTLFVGPLAADADAEGFDLFGVSMIDPIETEGAEFQVPADTAIGVVAVARGIGTVTEQIEVPRGASETLKVVLNAGLVNVTATGMADAGQVRVRDVGSGEFTGPEIEDDEVLTFFFPDGPRALEASQGFVRRQQSLDVVAGQSYDLAFEIGEGRLSLSLETAVPWSDQMPDARISVVGDERRVIATADDKGHASFSRMAFGEYSATVELGIDGPRYVRARDSAPIDMVVAAAETEVFLPFPLLLVQLDLQGWDAADLVDVDAMILSMIDLGLPYAAAKVQDSKATLAFVPLTETGVTETFAVAVARGNDVLAIVEIGALDVDRPRVVTLEKGGDPALCAAVTEVSNCNDLIP